jgi:hypothetical protein
MKIWKWLLLTVTALASYAFALLNPFTAPAPGIDVFTPTAYNESLTPTPALTAPSPTETAVPSTPTAAPTATPIPAEVYRLQPGSPVYLPFFRQPELGCAWTGVAGQIFDAQGEPVTGIVVVVEGALGDTPVDAVTVSGAAPAYGPGGYELQLGQQPIAAAGTLSLLLYDLDGVPLIQPLSFDTRAGCTQNLVLINFQQQ